ncbi:MAG TPA: PorV/PorQ family protein [Elusimicrobiota bacterium]|nr:PorV/PorQ family protein [Elusimicrobiota bacterium]
MRQGLTSSSFFGNQARRRFAGRLVSVLLAALQVVSLFPMSASAQAKGGAPGQFLSWGTGARSMGMGKAFSAIADDATSVYWNPAAMVQAERKELSAMHVTLFKDTAYDSISYVHPTSRAGTLGLNFTRLLSSGFEKIGISIDPKSQEIVKLEKLGTFDDLQQAYTLAYGKQFTEKMSIGVSVKQISHQMDTFKQGFVAVDAAFFGREFFPHHRIALVGQNIVSQVSGQTDDQLPLTVRVGNAYSLLRDRINLGLDITQNSFSGLGYNFGAEYWVLRWAALRLGIEAHSEGIAETSVGLGLKHRNYSLDVAMAIHELGMSQRVSASWRFGRSVKSSQREETQSLIEQGHEMFRQGNYLQAIQKFSAALDVNPSNKEVQAMVAKLQDIVSDLPKAPSGDVGRLVASGVKAYMDGDLNGAYDSFRAAFDKEPENGQLMNLTNRLAKQTNRPMVERPKGASAAARWTLVDQKLHDALQAIYEGRYDVAIQKCDEVLRIEPTNVVAIGRMGAAFFLLGERDKAVALWKRALELDPTHRPAIEYLQQLGEYKR